MTIARPPGPRGALVLGHLTEFWKDPLALFERVAQHGEVAQFRMGTRTVYLLTNPEHIKTVLVTWHRKFRKSPALKRVGSLLGDGLLTSDGDFHLRQRRLVQPAFHKARLEGYAQEMVRAATRRVTQAPWAAGTALDVSEEMMRITLSVVCKTLFDAEVEDEASEIGRAMTDVLSMFNTLVLPFHELMQKLPLPSSRRFQRARARLDATIYRFIKEHRDAPDRGDLLSMLLMAQDDEGDGERMTDRQLRDECLTLFTAGHETTANALTWTLYLLSQHPEEEAAVLEELQRVLGGRAPTFDDLRSLTRVHQVVSEALRLYPPAWSMSRQATEDIELGGYNFPAGSVLITSPWIMHHHPRYWEEPLAFRPSRWTPELAQTLPKFAYFPFGGGPRLCIGEQFAWTEAMLVLTVILQRWHLTLAPGARVAPLPVITLRTRYGMPMELHPRE